MNLGKIALIKKKIPSIINSTVSSTKLKRPLWMEHKKSQLYPLISGIPDQEVGIETPRPYGFPLWKNTFWVILYNFSIKLQSAGQKSGIASGATCKNRSPHCTAHLAPMSAPFSVCLHTHSSAPSALPGGLFYKRQQNCGTSDLLHPKDLELKVSVTHWFCPLQLLTKGGGLWRAIAAP